MSTTWQFSNCRRGMESTAQAAGHSARTLHTPAGSATSSSIWNVGMRTGQWSTHRMNCTISPLCHTPLTLLAPSSAMPVAPREVPFPIVARSVSLISTSDVLSCRQLSATGLIPMNSASLMASAHRPRCHRRPMLVIFVTN